MANAARAKSWFKSFRLAYSKTGGPPVIVWRETAEEIFEGDPLVISTNIVSEAVATSAQLYGIALAHTDTGDMCPIAVGDANNVFVGQADDDTGTLTDIPHQCDIVEGADGWKVDVGASAEDVLLVLDYVPGDDITDATTPGRLFFQILRSSWTELVADQT